MKSLEEIVGAGAVLSTVNGDCAVLAAADFFGNLLWWMDVSGAEGFLETDRMSPDFGFVRFYQGEEECAKILPVNESEDVARWKVWRERLAGPDGEEAASTVATAHRQAAIDAPEMAAGCVVTCTLTFEDGAILEGSTKSTDAMKKVPIAWTGTVDRVPDLPREAPAALLRAICRAIAERGGLRLSERSQGKYRIAE